MSTIVKFVHEQLTQIWICSLIFGTVFTCHCMHVCSLFLNSALEFMSTCKLANLTVRTELGCCLLHRRGKLTIDGCILQCESNPLDHLSYAIISTAGAAEVIPSALKTCSNGVSVLKTRIEGGAKAVLTSGTLSLQRVRVIYTRTSLFFWFEVEGSDKNTVQSASVELPIS
uniref:SKIP5 n=1 Tax=Solanum tuberosum TaxID=4113 RepID=M0ZXK5_SOLTU